MTAPRACTAVVAGAVLCGALSGAPGAVPTSKSGAAATRNTGAGDAAAFLTAWCVDCHDSTHAKGHVNFEALTARLSNPARTVEDADLLRRARIRIADGIMPPPGEEHPSLEDRAAVLPVLASLGRVSPDSIVPPGTAPRRLNRVEYANTVRDLFGVSIGDLGSLPPDDVGAGFDSVAAVLSLSPAAFERMMEMAEAIAQRACPDADPAHTKIRRVAGKDLRPPANAGAVHGQVVGIYSNGQADRAFELPRDGMYALSATAFGMQAGPEPVKMALVVDGRAIAQFDLPETEAAPGTRRAEVQISGGSHRIGVEFLNDYYVKGPPAQDRNLAVRELVVEGPVDVRPQPAWSTAMAAACANAAPADVERTQFEWLVLRVLRRPCTDADLTLLRSVTGSVAAGGNAKLRAAIVALLVHPEFLFRVESDPPAGEVVRDLSPFELATRLSYYLWASTPDDQLLAGAASGALATPAARAQQVARMLLDPRSSALAERFAPQWLGIDGVDTRMPDPTQFTGIDAPLVQSMRGETVLLFDTILREDRPATELLDANFTFVDARLAALYGMPAPASSGMRRVPAPVDRGGGVIAHASVLLATSNPTRTSPVKRGKWVLESLLDSAPPPPPPGAPALPERTEDRHGLTLRQSLEAHRADPKCAACHLRMDALGFALEHYDAVGRYRDRADGAPVDSTGQLPDGRTVASLAELRALLIQSPDFVRSLAKHLLIYATGRAAGPADEAAVDLLVSQAGPHPTLHQLVTAVAESPAFLRRGAPTANPVPPAPAPPVGVGQ